MVRNQSRYGFITTDSSIASIPGGKLPMSFSTMPNNSYPDGGEGLAMLMGLLSTPLAAVEKPPGRFVGAKDAPLPCLRYNMEIPDRSDLKCLLNC
jgi:hypothetical protein